MMNNNKEKQIYFDKQDIAYGFLKWASATYTEKDLGGYLAEIFMAIDKYEQHIMNEQCIDEMDE